MKCCSRKEASGLGFGKRPRRHGFRIILLGMLLGLVAGLLLAPRPGTETIESLSRKRAKVMEKLIRRLPV